MPKKLTALTILALLVVAPPALHAQVAAPGGEFIVDQSSGADWWYNPATAAESYARGWADMVRAQGQYHLLNSFAARNFARARSEEIENRYKYAKTYFELQQLNRDYRAQLRGPRATTEQLIRYAQAGAPARLGPEQLNPYTGELSWPVVLRSEPFVRQRQVIDQIFANRVLNDGRMVAEDYLILEQSLQQMQNMLKDRIQEYNTNAYLEARGFLDSLSYEATS